MMSQTCSEPVRRLLRSQASQLRTQLPCLGHSRGCVGLLLIQGGLQPLHLR